MKILLITLYLLNLLDMTSTHYGLNHGGYETNPMVRWYLSLPFGFLWFFVAKCIILLITTIICLWISKIQWGLVNFQRATNIALVVMNLIFAYVVLHNYQVITW